MMTATGRDRRELFVALNIIYGIYGKYWFRAEKINLFCEISRFRIFYTKKKSLERKSFPNVTHRQRRAAAIPIA
jgi:hypothetical protein